MNFDRSHLTVPQPWELARKVEISLIGSRAIDEPCALLLSPPNGDSKREFLHWRCFYFFVAGNRRHLIFNMLVECIKSQPTDDKTSRNGRGHVTWPILNFSPAKISVERLKLETSNLVCMLIIASPILRTTNCPW